LKPTGILLKNILMKKILLISIVALSSIAFSSCSKWLDLQPQDGITRAEFWKTKEDVRAAVFGIYSSLNAGAVEERLFSWGELRGDLIGLTTYASDDNRLVKNYNILSTNVISDWSAVYTAINDCNLLLDFAPLAKTADPTFGDAEYNSYGGVGVGVGCLVFFFLVRTFRDIPLKLKGTSTDTDIVSVGQSSESQVLKQIEADLIQAQTWVPEYHEQAIGYNASNTGRITKPAVTAMLADVYLWMEEYSKAEIETNKILNNNRYALVSNAWTSIFDGGTTETIFEISHKASRENPMFPLVINPRRPYMANVEILNAEIFPSNTETDVDLRDNRSEGYLYTSDGIVLKYGLETPDYFNFQIYRIADVMLMKAEALAELGKGAEALQIIKELRAKRKALQATDAAVDEGDLDGIIEYIFQERARELTFEGKRWFDLLRLAKKDNYSNLNILVDLITKTVDANVQQSAISKVRNTDSHYLPIAETELFKDPQLKQNPFYLK
jgi:hypothetical protein